MSAEQRLRTARAEVAETRALRTIIENRNRNRKRKRGDDAGGEGVPVEPNRPNNLTGGAAAALEFDD